MKIRTTLLLSLLLIGLLIGVEAAFAQSTATPFPTVELPWYTPTRVPVNPVSLSMPGIVPTMVEHYAQTANYTVQWWNTFTDPVSGIDRILTLFLMGVALFGLTRIFILIKGRWGQVIATPTTPPPAPTSGGSSSP